MKFLVKNSSGSAILTFIFFLPIIIGMLAFSLYIGNRSKDQVRVSQLSQIAADAMAAHSSQGLNTIAVNNQAIAASLQIHNSALVISSYGGIAKAFAYGLTDFGKDVKASFENFMPKFGDAIQEDIFDTFNDYAVTFINSASGATLYNRKLVQFWNYGATSSGAYIANKNSPSSLIIPMQGDGANASKIPYLNFGYEYLKTSTPQDAICAVSAAPYGEDDVMDLKASMNIIASPLTKHFGGGGFVKTMANFAGTLDSISPVKFSGTECGIALRSPLKNLFNAKDLIGSNTLSNILAKSMIIKTTAESFYSIWNKHPDGFPTCSARKTAASAPIMAEKVAFLADDSNTQASFESYSLKEAWNAGVKKIRYSELTPEECSQSGGVDNRCNLYFELGPETHLCPIFYEARGSGERVVRKNFKNAFSTISKYCQRTRGSFPNYWIDDVNVFNNVTGNLAHICRTYIPWAEAADKKPDAGFRLTNLATQMTYYLSDSSNQKQKYDIDRTQNKRSTIGFTYIQKSAYPAFLEHQSFKMGVAEPILNSQESLQAASDPSRCPLVIKGLTAIDGEVLSKCRVNTGAMLGYEIAPTIKENPNAVDGLGRILSGGIADTGQDSIFKRMQWGFSKSRVVYVKSPKDPEPPRFFQTMWPAWNNAPARASLTDFFGPESKLYKTALGFDKLLGKR